MQRAYEHVLKKHLAQYRQMIFLSGPRQVGKTTTSLEISSETPVHYYFNWDNEDHRALLIEGPKAIAKEAKLDEIYSSLPILVFDEIHKYRNWKQFLKGFFDTYEKKCRIVVTGSARLDVYKGAVLENFVASHLYKAVQFWTDLGLGEYELYYLRDKDKREVDFLVTKNRKPWFLVETKTSGERGISKWLYYYQEKLKVPHAFQIGFDLPYVHQDCFKFKEPIIVPAKTFLSQLV